MVDRLHRVFDKTYEGAPNVRSGLHLAIHMDGIYCRIDAKRLGQRHHGGSEVLLEILQKVQALTRWKRVVPSEEVLLFLTEDMSREAVVVAESRDGQQRTDDGLVIESSEAVEVAYAAGACGGLVDREEGEIVA